MEMWKIKLQYWVHLIGSVLILEDSHHSQSYQQCLQFHRWISIFFWFIHYVSLCIWFIGIYIYMIIYIYSNIYIYIYIHLTSMYNIHCIFNVYLCVIRFYYLSKTSRIRIPWLPGQISQRCGQWQGRRIFGQKMWDSPRRSQKITSKT